MKNRIVILGGYGTTGRLIANLLLAETSAEIILAGRSLNKAEQAATVLNAEHKGARVKPAFADAGDFQSLKEVFQGADMVISAGSTSDLTEVIASAALSSRIDYYDLQYSTEKIKILESMRAEIEKANLCFITDGGFHPGLPAAMVRYAAEQFDSLISANVSSVIKIDWSKLDLSPTTMQEFVRELMAYQPIHYRTGSWQKSNALAMMIPRFVDFREPFGKQYSVAMFLEEMRSLPEQYPSLKETGFFVGGFNWFTDWFLLPIIMLGMKLAPNYGVNGMSRLLFWGLKTFSHEPFGTMLKLEAEGTCDGNPSDLDVILSHPDGYMLTAIPVAACIRQYSQGGIRKPGLWYQANIVDTSIFFEDMKRMGVQIHESGSKFDP